MPGQEWARWKAYFRIKKSKQDGESLRAAAKARLARMRGRGRR